MKKLFPAFLLLLSALPAFGQSSPSWPYGTVPTPGQWSQSLTAKQDYLGYVPLSPTGAVMTGRFVTAAPTSTIAGFNVTPGSTPSAPLNGDIWATSANLFARIGGATRLISQDASSLIYRAAGVNFNSVADTSITMVLPPWATRYQVTAVRISGASASISSAEVGVFTAEAGGGTAIVASATAVTVSSASDATNNNSMTLTPTNSATRSFTLAGYPTLFFRVTTAQGTAATADVTITIVPLP